MLDHVCLNVCDLDRSKEFYVRAFAPLGVAVVMEFPGAVGLGDGGKPWYWLVRRDPVEGGAHVALATDDRGVVDAFHRAALAAGGADNGAPGPRPQYHAHYYGAFVLDPDGNNIEVVCHRPQG
ncbi:MAG: VOC family protein [Planctomycetota bacterium]